MKRSIRRADDLVKKVLKVADSKPNGWDVKRLSSRRHLVADTIETGQQFHLYTGLVSCTPGLPSSLTHDTESRQLA